MALREDVADFQWNVDAAGQRAKPFAPGLVVPQAPGFHPAHGDVGAAQQDDGVGGRADQLVHPVHQHFGVVRAGRQAEVADQIHHQAVQVMVQQA
ncbi:hypothetical protein SDC9_91369 [bioreactor metagenome]|uniref:Uncharacterized protein n=1 Tax=bioreactor metagenome TaxID=1076179 RepID=A0A644ZUP4_9ZZZZ